jgi:hypothetical protein
MRAIGELCRDVIAQSAMKAMLRGSFGPREFAVVFHSGGDVGFVRFNLSREVAQEDPTPADPNGGLVDSTRSAELRALEATRCLGTGVEAILLMRDGTQIDYPVVRPDAVDVINEAIGVRAVVQEPRDAVTLKYPPLEHDRDVLAVAHVAAQRAWLELIGLVAANASEHAAISVEGEIVTNLGRR